MKFKIFINLIILLLLVLLVKNINCDKGCPANNNCNYIPKFESSYLYPQLVDNQNWFTVTFYDQSTVNNPDFESRQIKKSATKGLVKSTLGPNRKPIYCCGNKTSSDGSIENEDSFNTWFNYVPNKNIEVDVKLTLHRKPNLDKTDNNITLQYFSDEFYPLDSLRASHLNLKELPFQEYYTDQNLNLHNYHFCFEFHSQFLYQGPQNISIKSDDDSFLFINGKLVIDLGGVHDAVTETLDLGTLGLINGCAYSFDYFFCERHSKKSEIKLEFPALYRTTDEYLFPMDTALFPHKYYCPKKV